MQFPPSGFILAIVTIGGEQVFAANMSAQDKPCHSIADIPDLPSCNWGQNPACFWLAHETFHLFKKCG